MSLSAGRLDLRAIEARLNATEVCYECRADMQALLAHVRALDAAARRVLDYRRHRTGCEVDQTDFCTCGMKEAADALRAVLAAAGDRPPAPREADERIQALEMANDALRSELNGVYRDYDFLRAEFDEYIRTSPAPAPPVASGMLPAAIVAHQCGGLLRPYPPVLCSLCVASAPVGVMTLRELVDAFNDLRGIREYGPADGKSEPPGE